MVTIFRVEGIAETSSGSSTCRKDGCIDDRAISGFSCSMTNLDESPGAGESGGCFDNSRKRRRRFGPKPSSHGEGALLDSNKAPLISLAPEAEQDVENEIIPGDQASAKQSEDDGELAKAALANIAVSDLKMKRCRSVDCYERLNYIDEGTYGRVFRARDFDTGQIFALKQVKLVGEREGFPVTALREISVLLSLRHPNIVHVHEVVVGSTLDKIYMVMEYAEHDLRLLLDNMKHPYSQSEVKSLVQQLLRGVAHIHAHWVIHRDLKTSNLLLNNGGILKLCDFGLARRYGDPAGCLTPSVSTLWYRAPELLLGASTYSTAVDMWSVGCIFAELVLMESLLQGKGELDQLSKICDLIGAPCEENWPGFNDLPNARRLTLRGPVRSKLSERFHATAFTSKTPLTPMGIDLIEQMLTLDPARRISAAEALQHPYFAEAPLPKDPQLIQTMPEMRTR